jgi:hypothetical protein
VSNTAGIRLAVGVLTVLRQTQHVAVSLDKPGPREQPDTLAKFCDRGNSVVVAIGRTDDLVQIHEITDAASIANGEEDPGLSVSHPTRF